MVMRMCKSKKCGGFQFKRQHSQGLPADAVTPYWTAVLGLAGIDEIGFIDAEGTDPQPKGKAKKMQSAMQQMRESLLKKMSLLLINC